MAGPLSAETPGTFAGEYLDAIQSLRGALTGILSSIGADAGDSADIARRLGIHKLLAWRLSKIVTTTDTATPIRQMPGAAGLKILNKAFTQAGVPDDRVETFLHSIAAYREMVERHAGDAASLEVMLASRQDDPAFAEEAVGLRKQAFRGAAAVWGVLARVELAMTVVAPTHHGDNLLDLGTLVGFFGFRRLRESTFCPFHAARLATDDGNDLEARGGVRLDWSLVRPFCSTPLPEFEETEVGDQRCWTVKPGPVGKTSLLTWVVERIKPALVSRYRDAENEFGQHSLVLRMPVELLHYDVLIHRDLSFERPPEASMCGDTAGLLARVQALPDERFALPLAERVVPLGSHRPALSTPHVRDVTEMAEHLCTRVGRSLDEFTAYRFTMPYPPTPTVLFLRYPLMTR